MTVPNPSTPRPAEPAAPGEGSWNAYRELVRSHPTALRFGLNLAFYRCFAVPEIATVLARSGGITGDPLARAKATGRPLFRVLESGFDDPGAEESLDRLRRVHHGLPVGDDAFVYVLGLFCVHPLRFLDRYGPRPATEAEREAAHTFYTALGRRIGITAPPAGHRALAAFTDAYEQRSFRPTPEGRALWRSARTVFARRLPAPVAGLGPLVAECLMDPSMGALGIPRRPAPLRWVTTTALRRHLARDRRTGFG
ncbi:oxygenase MpaB family protein [Streptomyces sp. NPDC000594]|uniref:oxygenase MpaB family protein n=1 Tax=Streptomyces sp. NPDC000594 TaxID=3154261 RepID=UPI003329BBDE